MMTTTLEDRPEANSAGEDPAENLELTSILAKCLQQNSQIIQMLARSSREGASTPVIRVQPDVSAT